MAYVSLYRKWRPQTFDEVVGQEYVTRILSNSLRNGSFAHAYLFAGPRGTGKTSTARILAKALNCAEGPTPNPCNRCDSCRQITEGSSVDVIEIDAASNRGIDDIRDLRERVIFSPAAARMKVYILDEAHMITTPAFNALLKMLEEPPAHVVFVLATTEPQKMPPTIISRCQRLDFRNVPVSQLIEHLERVCAEEGAEASQDALRLMARRARGSARDALVILEQAISYGDGAVDEAKVSGLLGLAEDEMLVRLGDSLAGGDAAEAVSMVERAYEQGRDLVQFAREAQEHFRRVFLLHYTDLGPEELEVDEDSYAHLKRQAEALSPARTYHFIAALREAAREMQATSSPRLVLESALLGMARDELDISPEAIAARLERLEGGYERLTRAGSGRPAQVGAAAESAPGEEAETRMEGPGKEAAAEPAAGTGAPSAGLDLAAVRRAWPQIRERVKEKKITTHAFMLEGKPSEVRDGELTVVFPADRAFHRGEMEKDDHRRVLEEALEEVLGERLSVTTSVEEETVRKGEEPGGKVKRQAARRGTGKRAGGEEGVPGPAGVGGGEGGASRDEDAPPDAQAGEAAPAARRHKGERPAAETHDAGKVKLVKDIFGAEMIEEIKLGE